MPKGQITIRDLVITPILEPGMVYTGEARPYSGAYRPLTDDPDVVPRLTDYINELIDIAALDHQTHNTTKDLNYITRLSTHEFFFYTQKPLSLQEFEILQNNIALKLKSAPPGIQLILGSFAIQNDNDQIINVTPLIFSGNPASFHFIAKNYTSPIDVRYQNTTGEAFEPWDKFSESPASSITVDDQIREFQLVSFVQCVTAGATPFLTVVDICLDHYRGTSIKYLTEKIEEVPQLVEQPISQVVISNTVDIQPKHCIVGPVLHVDSRHSTAGCKYRVTQTPSTPTLQHSFGQNKISMLCLEPSVCLSGSAFHISPHIESLGNSLQAEGLGPHDKKMNTGEALLNIVALITKYGDVNAVINSGMTPLHYAAKNGLIHAAHVLIKSGAQVNAKTSTGYTALHYAAQQGHEELVRALLDIDKKQLEATADMGFTPLHLAINYRHLNAVQALIDHQANVNAKTDSGLTALYMAVEDDNRDMVGMLLEKKATIDKITLSAAQDKKPILLKLVNTILTQDDPTAEIQDLVVQLIFQKTIKTDRLTKPIKDPILRAKIYLTEKDIDPKKVTEEDISLEAAIFITLYRQINVHETQLKQDFLKMLMDLMNTKKPEKIDLFTQVITQIYAINPDDITIKSILDRFIKIEQSTHIPLSASQDRHKANKETDIKRQLVKIKLAYLKLPHDDGVQLLNEFKVLCKIVAYRRGTLDFFGTPTSMQNLAELLSTEEYSELRKALKITSNNPKTLLKLIDCYANQKDIDDYEPGKPIPTIKRS